MLLIIVALISAGGIWYLWNTLSKIVLISDAVLGDNTPANPGLREIHRQVVSHGSAITKIEYELSPNGGHSLKDAVDRTEQQVTNLDKKVELIQQKQDLLAANKQQEYFGRYIIATSIAVHFHMFRKRLVIWPLSFCLSPDM